MPEQNIVLIIVGAAALIIGIIAGKLIFIQTIAELSRAHRAAQKILVDAQTNSENLKKEKLLEAKEKFVQMKAEHDKEVLERNRRLGENENR